MLAMARKQAKRKVTVILSGEDYEKLIGISKLLQRPATMIIRELIREAALRSGVKE